MALLIVFFAASCDNKEKHDNRPLAKKQQKRMVQIAGLRWYLDIQEALKKAKEQNQTVLVMVGEDNCRWCKKMKSKTLTDRRVQEKLKSYILVSIKRSDKKSIGHIESFDGNIPSFFFMKHDKEQLESIIGYFKADDFLGYLDEMEE